MRCGCDGSRAAIPARQAVARGRLRPAASVAPALCGARRRCRRLTIAALPSPSPSRRHRRHPSPAACHNHEQVTASARAESMSPRYPTRAQHFRKNGITFKSYLYPRKNSKISAKSGETPWWYDTSIFLVFEEIRQCYFWRLWRYHD